MVRLFTAKSSWLLSLAIFSLCMRDAKLVPDRFLKWGKDRFLEGKKIRKIESAHRSRARQRCLAIPEMGKPTRKRDEKATLSSGSRCRFGSGFRQLPTTARNTRRRRKVRERYHSAGALVLISRFGFRCRQTGISSPSRSSSNRDNPPRLGEKA